MATKFEQRFAAVFLGLVIVAIIGVPVIGTVIAKQERDDKYPQTRAWMIDNPASRPRVTVIDTAGVCLYITDISYNSDGGAAIAAVPKTQLPKGAGCQ